MDSKQLSNFLLVVEKGSVSRAAQDSYITSQAILQQMNALEAEVGVKLLDRSPRGVQCTPAGQFLYEKLSTLDRYFQDVLDECRRIGAESPGAIRVGTSSLPIFCFVAEQAFARSHPTIAVEHVEVEASEVYEKLLDGAIDVSEFGPAPLKLPDELIYTKIAYFALMCVMSADNPLAAKELIETSDLEGFEIGTREGRLARNPLGSEESLDNAKAFEPKPLTKDEAIALCLNGGVFLAPFSTASIMFPLVSIPIDLPKVETGLLSRKDSSSVVDDFIEVAKESFYSDSAWQPSAHAGSAPRRLMYPSHGLTMDN